MASTPPPPEHIYVDRRAWIMLGFMIDNLDFVEHGGISESDMDAACNSLFPDTSVMRLAIPAGHREVALRILASFIEQAEATALEHAAMIAQGEEPPCSPGACRRAAEACKAGYALISLLRAEGNPQSTAPAEQPQDR